MNDRSDSESNEEKYNFVINLKNGIGKYKCKIPFKCFDHGEVGHCATKFPYKNKNNEEDSNFKRYRK
jgi:hypothetical protein